MGTASFEFLGFALIAVIVFNLNRSLSWRQWTLLAANLAFLSFFSHQPALWMPLLCFLAFGFVSLRLMQSGRSNRAFLPLVALGIFGFVWLKKYSFIPPAFYIHNPYVTLGLSYIFFRVLHLIIDARNGSIPQRVSLLSYLNYTVNFTTFVSGPIQRYQDFACYQLASTPISIDILSAGSAFERIIRGFFKVNILSLALSMQQTRALESLHAANPASSRLWDGMLIIAIYPLYLYCNFSGYIDMVIGIARFLRMELPENFDRPFSAGNFMNFWSRWHITLSEWLKTYVYNPLVISAMRKYSAPSLAPFLSAFAIFVTFFLVGVWHGQTSEFLFFGLLQGFGVAAVQLYQVFMNRTIGKKRYRTLGANVAYHAFARGLTFTWFAFTLLWFWSNWTQISDVWNKLSAPLFFASLLGIFLSATVVLEAWERLRQLLLHFDFGGQPLVLSRYTRTVFTTAMAVVAIAVTLLLNAPAPDLVYKAF